MGAVNPKAWVLVPVEPTPEMVEAHYRAHAEAETVLADAQAVWAAMIAVAPNYIPDAGGMVDAVDREMIDSGDRIGAKLARDLLAHFDAAESRALSLEEEVKRLEQTLIEHASKHGPLFIEHIEDLFSALRGAALKENGNG